MPINHLHQQQRQRPQRRANRSAGSSVHTTTEESVTTATIPRTLRLRGESPVADTESTQEQQPASRPRVRWDENVVNNEGMGKKSSKVCCIYHRPRALDESSSESSDSESSSDDSDSDVDMHATRKIGRRQRRADHEHNDASCPGHSHDDDIKRGAVKKKLTTNAYERVPKNDRKQTAHNKTS